MKTDNTNFGFSKRLDREFLEGYYEDTDQAAMVFQIFLDTIWEEISKLKRGISSKQRADFFSQAHKMKPGFSMVGLTEMSRKISDMEKWKTQPEIDWVSLKSQVDDFIHKLTKEIPLIQGEYERLQEFMYGN